MIRGPLANALPDSADLKQRREGEEGETINGKGREGKKDGAVAVVSSPVRERKEGKEKGEIKRQKEKRNVHATPPPFFLQREREEKKEKREKKKKERSALALPPGEGRRKEGRGKGQPQKKERKGDRASSSSPATAISREENKKGKEGGGA